MELEPVQPEPVQAEPVQPWAPLPVRNLTNFLINVPGQWQYRPGLNRQEARPDSITTPPGELTEFFYSHETSSPFYPWVSVGTYMATHTRMTTMEAANESARHAVNAILYNIKAAGTGQFQYAGKLVGEPCDIWDPEENEPRDLDYFKQLDQALYDEGLPHFLDILKVEEIVEGLPGLDELSQIITEAQALLLAQVSADPDFLEDAAEYLTTLIQDLLEPLSDS